MTAEPNARRRAARRNGAGRDQSDEQHAKARLARLTRREREIMLMVIRGLTSRQISGELGISHRTVEAHRGRIMLKTGVHSSIELVRLALRSSDDGSARTNPIK